MRVVFLGNHTVGVTALSVLAGGAEVVGVVAHPLDPEDGVLYQSVSEYAKSCGFSVIRGKASEPRVADFIAEAKPDLLWITDYRYLLPAHLLCIAPLGTINLHPSLLPSYRGRAPINWAILHGETELGLTAHFVDEGMDSGDIIEQEYFELSVDEDVGDALSKLIPLYAAVSSRILKNLQTGNIVRRKQDDSRSTYFPARKPEDGLIDWGQSAMVIVNLVRAVAKPYPGAFTFMGGAQILIWKACLAKPWVNGQAGTIIGFEQGAPVVACGGGALVLTLFELPEAENCKIELGVKFTMKKNEEK